VTTVRVRTKNLVCYNLRGGSYASDSGSCDLYIHRVPAVLGLIAYRLAWAAPFLARLGVLPRSWRRWILDVPQTKKPE
jgi:hypothetical protein